MGEAVAVNADAAADDGIARLPLEAEIFRNAKYSPVGQKLQAILEKDEGDDNKFSQDNDDSDDTGLGSSPGVSFSLLGAKTLYWYRKARKLIEEETNKVTAGAVGGEIDASALPKESIDFLNLYLNHQDTWQEVCLVAEKNEENGMASTLVLNRPMAFSLSDSIARLILFGAYKNDLGPEEMEIRGGEEMLVCTMYVYTCANISVYVFVCMCAYICVCMYVCVCREP